MSGFEPAYGLALLAAGGGLTDLDTGLFIWTLVMFAVFAGLLARFAWGPILRIVEEREQGVREAVEQAQRSNAEAKELLEKHRELLRSAGQEREDVIKRALGEAEQVKNDIVGKARAEGEQLVARAKQQIEREKAQAIQDLRAQVADLAVEAASRIVSSSLTPEAQRKLVDDFIKELPEARA